MTSHLSAAHRVAAGLHAEPALSSSLAAAQGAWRFFAHEDTTLPVLAGPLLDCARSAIPDACDGYTLVPLDWCDLHLAGHESKADRVELANKSDLGYELLTALAVSDRDGSPIAPLCLEMRSAAGMRRLARHAVGAGAAGELAAGQGGAGDEARQRLRRRGRRGRPGGL